MSDDTRPGEDVQEERPEPTLLLDAPRIAREYGINLNTAYRLMQGVGVFQPPGIRKLYVRRADLEAYIDANTTKEAPSTYGSRPPGSRSLDGPELLRRGRQRTQEDERSP